MPLVATYTSLDRAREAMTALERSGIEGADVSLEGDGADSRPAGSDDSLRERDRGVARQFASRAFVGAGIGLVVGVLVGLLIGSLSFERGSATIASAIAGGLAGAALGGVWGGLLTPAMSRDWERTHVGSSGGSVRVAVTTDDAEALDRAERILREKDAVSVERR